MGPNRIHQRSLQAGLLLLGAGLAGGATAGSAIVSTGDGSSATFEYNDTMLRMTSAGAEDTAYSIMRDGKLYAVTYQGGSPMVIDAGSMIKSFAGMANQAAPSNLDARVISMKDTGDNETVAGIKGDVYELRFIDEDGTERTDTMVLSTDRRAREFRDALFQMMSFAQELASEQAMEQGRDMQARLDKMDAGILRFGQEMSVTSITSDKIPDERFELPAKPMNMEGLGDLIGNIAAQAEAASAEANASAAETAGAEPEKKKGGLFSGMMGALGGKAEEKTDTVGDKVVNEADKKADEGVDKAIGKAFKKLFGD